jgi:hypothetical protein
MENKTSENVRRSFSHTNSYDEIGFVQTPKNMANPVTILFVPFSKIAFCHNYFVLSSENHYLNKFHVNIKIDNLLLRHCMFAENLFSTAASYLFYC